MSPFTPYRECDPPRAPGSGCVIFQWVGQSLESCDGCGNPIWAHLYHPPNGTQRPIFHVKQQDWQGRWVWMPVGSLVTRR
jgi:hypothetical protein